jgi:hypothetical protein
MSPMIIHEMICSNMSYLLRKKNFFHQKVIVTLSHRIRQNGPEINLPVSRTQRTFGPSTTDLLLYLARVQSPTRP